MWQTIAEHVLSFGVGVFVGLLAASRYRIVRINGNGKEPPP